MPDRFFLGYSKFGSEVYLRESDIEHGLILRGKRCIRLVRNIVWEMKKYGKRIIAVSLLKGFAPYLAQLLPEADLESLLGYIFTYENTERDYHYMLASAISLAFNLSEDSEYTLRDAIKSLADAEGAGGIFAILSAMDEDDELKLIKKRLNELIDIPFTGRKRMTESFTADFSVIPSTDARVALSLACISKFALTGGDYIILLGWEIISHAEKASRKKFQHLFLDIMSRAKLLALQSFGDSSPLFAMEIREQGPIYILIGDFETYFASPELVSSSKLESEISDLKRADEKAIMVILRTIKSYRNTTLAGIISYLGAQMEEEVLRNALEVILAKRLAILAYGDSQAKVLKLTEEGENFLRNRGVS